VKESKRKILFITGTRADYGKLKPLMKSIEEDVDCELYIFVGGMHLLSIFGSTYTEVLKDGYKNVYVAHGLTLSDKMSVNLGNTIVHITGYVSHIEPDMIVVHGDRIDALAGAVVGALNNIIVSHVEGGEISGTIDESIRHAVSKFAHLHFVANEDAKKRIIQLGENLENIFIIGSPDIDIMLNGSLPSIEETKKYYEIDFDKYGIFIYHPVTTEYEKTAENIRSVVDAMIKSGKKYVLIYPNSDCGSEIILNEYSRLKDNSNFAIFPSMKFEYFLTLLKNTDFIMGNSSSGIREASIYSVPTIDIGSRQQGRYNLSISKNIQHVIADDDKIIDALENIKKHGIKQMHFGGGDSAKKFIEIISNDGIWEKEMQKKFIDIE